MPDAFDIAKNATKNSEPIITRYRHSSVILDRKGRIISVGRNHYTGKVIHTDEGPIKKTIHSEIHALTQVNIRRLEGATIINYARTNVASILAKPCPNCNEVLKKLGFKKVFYTVRSELDKPKWVEEKINV